MRSMPSFASAARPAGYYSYHRTWSEWPVKVHILATDARTAKGLCALVRGHPMENHTGRDCAPSRECQDRWRVEAGSRVPDRRSGRFRKHRGASSRESMRGREYFTAGDEQQPCAQSVRCWCRPVEHARSAKRVMGICLQSGSPLRVFTPCSGRYNAVLEPGSKRVPGAQEVSPSQRRPCREGHQPMTQGSREKAIAQAVLVA